VRPQGVELIARHERDGRNDRRAGNVLLNQLENHVALGVDARLRVADQHLMVRRARRLDETLAQRRIEAAAQLGQDQGEGIQFFLLMIGRVLVGRAGLVDEGSLALDPLDDIVLAQFAQGMPNRLDAAAQLFRQNAFGRQRVAVLQMSLGDLLHDEVLDLLIFQPVGLQRRLGIVSAGFHFHGYFVVLRHPKTRRRVEGKL